MNKSFEQLMEEAKKVRLNESDHSLARQDLLAFIEMNPHVAADGRWRVYATNILHFVRSPVPVLISVSLIIAASAGVSYAAEGSLPGNILYPIKVHVNEEVHAKFMTSPEARARWEAQRAERRIEEAERLAANGALSPATKLSIEQNFNDHVQRVNLLLQDVEDKDNVETAADISSDFETALQIHEKILDSLAGQVQATQKDFIAQMSNPITDAQTNRDRIENKFVTQDADRLEQASGSKRASVQNKIKDVETLMTKVQNKIDPDEIAQAQARLADAKDLLVQADAKITAKSFGDAFRLMQNSQDAAQEASLLIRAGQEFKIEIRFFDNPPPAPTVNINGAVQTGANIQNNNVVNVNSALQINTPIQIH